MGLSEINWGIIGCGDVTEVKSGPAFNKVPASRLVAVMRRNAEKAEDYALRHGVPKWFTDANLLINDPNLNAIYIATPPLHHEEYALAAISAGKPVYVEKPMSLNAAGAERMKAASQETGVKLSIAHYRRQLPLFLKIKALLEEGVIGDVRLANLQYFQPHNSSIVAKTEDNWRLNPSISGGGLFHDLAPHQLDLMLYFFGKPIEVKGVAFNASKLYAADDVISGQILFPNDVLFTGTWAFTVPEKRDICEIIGSKGTLRFSIFNHHSLSLIQDNTETKMEFNPPAHIQQPMIERVVQYFLGKEENPCSAGDGVEVMRMIDALAAK